MANSQRAIAMMRGFGKRLKAARTVAGFDAPEDLASHLGIRTPAYRKYERGDAWPPLHILANISASTKASLHWLLLGVGPALVAGVSFGENSTEDNQCRSTE